MSMEFSSIKESVLNSKGFDYSFNYKNYSSDTTLDLLDQFEKFISSKKFPGDSSRKINTLFEEILNPMPELNDLKLNDGQSHLKISYTKKELTFYLFKDKFCNQEQLENLKDCLGLINLDVNNDDKKKLADKIYDSCKDKEVIFHPPVLINTSKVSQHFIHTNFEAKGNEGFSLEFIVKFNMEKLA